jgi:hypothetical protein
MRIPSEQSIRERAYQLWEQDGRPDGRSIDYWLQAARELEEEEVARSAQPDGDPVREPKPSVNAGEFRERVRQPNMRKRRVKDVGVPNGAGARPAEKAAAMPQPVRNAP